MGVGWEGKGGSFGEELIDQRQGSKTRLYMRWVLPEAV